MTSLIKSRVLNAYHSDNFRKKNWCSILRRAFFSFASTAIVFLIPFAISLHLWHLIEVGADFERVAVTFPLAVSLVQMEITCIVLITKSRALSNTINRLQDLVDQRKCYLAASSCQFTRTGPAMCWVKIRII